MSTIRSILLTYIVLQIVIILAGCKPEQTPTQPEIYSSNSTTTVAESPAVSADKGAFRIVLIYSQSGDPVRGQNLYLAEMHPLQGELEGAQVPVLDTNTAPRAESSFTGEVVMSLVTPGKYALACLTPVGPILIVDSESNREITLEINAGEVTDLGNHLVVLDQSLLEPDIAQ